MNMLALRCDGDMIVIDAGILFPGVEQMGVDVIVPDLTFLRENRKQLRGLIATHGHEDHIGAIPYVLSELNPPVYATHFTQRLIQRRLEEHELPAKPEFRRVVAGETVRLGCFGVEFIHVTHSTVDCVALAIDTPLGTVVHTADFKIDQTPVRGPLFDLHAFAEHGKKGVLLLLSDSTNVDRPGITPSERTIRPAFEDIFSEADNSIFLTCFSSATHRVQQILDLAYEFDRKVAFIGRSLSTASEIAQELGHLSVPPDTLIRPQEMSRIPREQRVMVVSGSQGEPMSSMSRASVGKHRHAVIEEGDDVIISARIIPGNEKPIYRMIDHLCRRGANVHYGNRNPPLHVSGHAAAEELKLILNLTRPRFFMPVHGEYRQLSQHAKLAEPLKDQGLEESFILQSGETLIIDEHGAHRGEEVPVGRVFIDTGTGEEIIEELVIRDRQHLSEFGVIVPIVAIDRQTGKVSMQPEIVSRGFAVSEESEEMLDGAVDIIRSTVEGSSREEIEDLGLIEEKIRTDLKRYVSRKTSRSSRPLIVPVVLEN